MVGTVCRTQHTCSVNGNNDSPIAWPEDLSTSNSAWDGNSIHNTIPTLEDGVV